MKLILLILALVITTQSEGIKSLYWVLVAIYWLINWVKDN